LSRVVEVATARAETDDRGMEPKAEVLCDTGKLSNWDKLSRAVSVIFFNLVYFDAPRMAHMPVDDRGDLYSHTFTYSHIVGNIPRK
jgi:hypothetical protein